MSGASNTTTINDDEGNSLNLNFSNLGYESIYFARNIGFIITLLLLFFIVGFLLMISKILCCCKRNCVLTTNKLFLLLINNFIRTVLEAYLEIAICVGLNIDKLSFNDDLMVISSILTILFFLILFLLFALSFIMVFCFKEHYFIAKYL